MPERSSEKLEQKTVYRCPRTPNRSTFASRTFMKAEIVLRSDRLTPDDNPTVNGTSDDDQSPYCRLNEDRDEKRLSGTTNDDEREQFR